MTDDVANHQKEHVFFVDTEKEGTFVQYLLLH